MNAEMSKVGAAWESFLSDAESVYPRASAEEKMVMKLCFFNGFLCGTMEASKSIDANVSGMMDELNGLL